MKLTGDLPGFIFVVQQPYLQDRIFWRWGINGQAAESIHVHLRLPGAVFHREVVLFQHGRPAVKESGFHAHHLQPLQCVVVGVDLKWHRHQVRSELRDGPDDGEALQFGGGIRFFRLVEGARSTADDVLLAFPYLCEDCAEACCRRVAIQTKWQAEVGEGSDRAGGEESLEAIEGVLAIRIPVEDRIFPGKSMKRPGNGGEVLNIMLVISGETQKRANFRGLLGGTDLSDGC